MYTISFFINYHTASNQHLAVVGDLAQLGAWDPSSALLLASDQAGNWMGSIEIPELGNFLHYKYLVLSDLGMVDQQEWVQMRQLELPNRKNSKIWLRDEWRATAHPENAYYNAAFLEVIFKRQVFRKLSKIEGQTLRFQISVPDVPPGHQLCILGNIESLGAWDLRKPLLMSNADFPWWQTNHQMPARAVIEYKYGYYNEQTQEVSYLEEGANRTLSTYHLQDKELVVITDGYFRSGRPKWRGSGVAIPVFSLRTKAGFGVGSFSDLIPLIDWAKSVGMQLVQTLPVNDTIATKSRSDSSPYAAISVFALHPIYLDLEKIPDFAGAIDLLEYERKKEAFNQLARLDYEQVMESKWSFLQKIFDHQKGDLLLTSEFRAFQQENAFWLQPYQCFCVLRDRYGTADFSKWETFSSYSSKVFKKLLQHKRSAEQLLFYAFIQYHLDRQLRSVRAYARSCGIVLKGDLAIGVSRYSADVWAHPALFHLDQQAGAPPDPFSGIGQNWGLPPYNWELMAKDGYKWWSNRLGHFSKYFDAFRIDHILGFFRIWQIPIEDMQGLLGFFSPALPVTRDEFILRGIDFDRNRFCEPYITPKVISEIFGEQSQAITEKYLKKSRAGHFRFKTEFATQKKIEAHFYSQKSDLNLDQQKGIFKLHAEVLFLPENTGGEEVYHPRIDFQKTHSFAALTENDQEKFNELYYDYFYHRQETYWRNLGLEKLPVIKSASEMLVCGEDLGMIPQCVPEVMKELDILTLEVERLSKNSTTRFALPKDIPYLSVGCTSSHDMLPLRAWWENLDSQTRTHYFKELLFQEGDPPKEATVKVIEKIIRRHLAWPSMWIVIPIQDVLALSNHLKVDNSLDERINIPGDTQHYWQYLIPLTLDQLLAEAAFNHRLKKLFKR